jgi:hypothetical protein
MLQPAVGPADQPQPRRKTPGLFSCASAMESKLADSVWSIERLLPEVAM